MQAKVNVLVVDDSPSWCSIYQEALVESGCSVYSAPDLSSALRALDRLFFHVAIVDIRLDHNDRFNAEGLDVLQRIWELNEGTLAVVSSGHVTADMLPSFRTYGVFDFVARTDADPTELARQYRSAAFIKGAIDKAGSLEDGLKRIRQAIAEATRSAASRQWLVSPFRVFKGLDGRSIQSGLKGAGTLELRPCLGQLCRPLFPWLHGRRNALMIRDDEGNVLAVEGYIWSRALGMPVVIRLARRGGLQASIAHARLGVSWPGATPAQQILHHASAHFEGVVHAVNDMAFEDHFDPPRPRRASH